MIGDLCVIDVIYCRSYNIWSNGNMGREEQIEEREVLDSIFPDEITGILCRPDYTCDRRVANNMPMYQIYQRRLTASR